jgi:hypothetical protein
MIPGASFTSRIAAGALALAFIALSDGASAQQQSCSEDFAKLAAKRMEAIQALNNLGKAGKGKMDPMAACPAAKKLLGTETEMLNYMAKNKEWCNIPEPVIENFKQARTKSQGFASQACTVAAKMKEAQEQAAQGGGPGMAAPPRLPAGPL